MMIRWHLFVGLLALSVCAPLRAENKIRIVNEGGIRDEWTLAPGVKLPVPAYPKAYPDGVETCVAIGYLLNPDGTTSDFALLKSWSAKEPKRDRDAYWAVFAQDASNALALWKFVPRPEVDSPKPVYTVATFLFAPTNAMESRKRCGIPDLALRLVELRKDAKAGRRMGSKSIFERLDIDPLLEQRYRLQERQREEALRPNEPQPQPQPAPQPNPPPPPPSGGG